MALIMVVSFDGGAVVVSFDGGVDDTTMVMSSNNGVLISNIAWGMVEFSTSWVVVVIGETLMERIDAVVNCTPIRVNNNSKLTNLMI